MAMDRIKVDIPIEARDRIPTLRDKISFVSNALETDLDFLTGWGQEGMVCVLRDIADELDGMSDGYILVPTDEPKTSRKENGEG